MKLAEAFDVFKTRLELSDSYGDIVQRRHAAVRECVERALPFARTQLIGSLQRKTRINPLKGLDGFDIDILVELGSFDHWETPERGITCQTALGLGETAIASNLSYRKKGIEQDQPAIVVPYDDGSYVEVVPAYRDQFPNHIPIGRAYYVPRTGRWTLSDYDYDAEQISVANTKLAGGRLIPAIKMLKAWRRNLVPSLRSYHLEVLALGIVPVVVEFYRNSNLVLGWSQLLCHFFELAAERIAVSSAIPGSLSEPADYYLSGADRQRIASSMRSCCEAAKASLSCNDSQSIQLWRLILGEPFPAP